MSEQTSSDQPSNGGSTTEMESNGFEWSPSTRKILEVPLDYKSKVDSFRKLLETKLGEKSLQQHDDHTLFRFLRFYNYEENKAEVEFKKYVDWREKIDVDKIVQDFKGEDMKSLKELFPQGYHGVAKDGRPVYIQLLGKFSLAESKKDIFKRQYIYELEKNFSLRFPACTLATKEMIDSSIVIIDVNGMSLRMLNFFEEIQKIGDNYVGTIHKIYIINSARSTFLFDLVWVPAQRFLSEQQKSKIQKLDGDYKSHLMDIIEKSQLPEFLGGNCTCSEFGGCLFSDRGPWNDPKILKELQEKTSNQTGKDDPKAVAKQEEARRGDPMVVQQVDKSLLEKMSQKIQVLIKRKLPFKLRRMIKEDDTKE